MNCLISSFREFNDCGVNVIEFHSRKRVDLLTYTFILGFFSIKHFYAELEFYIFILSIYNLQQLFHHRNLIRPDPYSLED